MFVYCTSRLEAMLPDEDQRSIISTPESSEMHYTEFKVLSPFLYN